MKKPRHVVPRNGGYYYQATKPMRDAGMESETLPSSKTAAYERAKVLNDQWDEIRKAPPKPKRGDINDLISQFQKDPVWYGRLARVTRVEIDYALDIFAEEFGQMRVGSPQRQHCRVFYNRLRVEGSPHKARKVMKWVKRLFNYSVEMGLRDYSPADKMQMETVPGRSQTWEPKQVEVLKSVCIAGGKAESGNLIPPRPSIALATQLAYDTSQREQDVLSFTRHMLDDGGIEFTQKKTGKRLWVPLSDESKRMIDLYGGDLFLVISEETKRPYTKDAFTRIFRKFAKRAKVPDELQFRDLRRTALTEMGNQGATIVEINAFGGHEMNSSVTPVYVRPDREAALRGAKKRKEQ